MTNDNLSNELLDIILYICFNFVTDEYTRLLKNKKNIHTLEFINTPNKEYIESFGKDKNKDKYDISCISIKQWSIDTSIYIHFTYHSYTITECFVYHQRSPDDIIVIGCYLKHNMIHFYNTDTEYKNAFHFAIALFYILDPDLFRPLPDLEMIAKNIIKYI